MSTFAGFDISQAKTHISVVDDQGKELWHGSVTTSPDALALAVQEHAAGALRIGMESGPLSPWLFHALKAKGLPIICIDAKAAEAGLQLQGPNKTDRKDAKGIARIMQTNVRSPSRRLKVISGRQRSPFASSWWACAPNASTRFARF